MIEVIQRAKGLRLLRPILSYYYDRRFENNREGQLFRGVFATADEAAASAPPAIPVGYDQPGPAAMYRDSLESIRDSDYPVLYWMLRLLPSTRRVLDYGGHVGIKYYGFSKYLSFSSDFLWTVCDVPHVAQAGRELALERRATGIRFVSDFNAVDGTDLLLCSGSLQYIAEPLANQLAPVANRPKSIIVNATPFSTGPTFFTLNSIGTAVCPYKVENLDEFTSQMRNIGYTVVDRWTISDKACIIPLHPERTVHAYSGLYLRREA